MNRTNLSYQWLKAVILLFAGVLPLEAYGQLCDTLQVSFRNSQSVYDAAYKENGMRVDCFVEAVKQQAQHTPPNQIQLTVYTGASPEGSYQRNHRLGEQRGISMKQVLDERLYGTVDDIRLVNSGPRWGELRRMVEASEETWRDTVLSILDSPEPTTIRRIDTREERLRKLDGGSVWQQLRRNYFPSLLQTATIVAVYRPIDTGRRDTIVIRDTIYNFTQITHVPDSNKAALGSENKGNDTGLSQEPTSRAKADHRRLWAVKTNMLLWGILAPNIEIEVPLGNKNRWSIEGELFCPWWTWSHNSYAIQALNIGAELRYWLGNRETRSTLSGWHLGLALALGYYDMEWKRSDGYQGEYLNTYINIGYQHRFGRHWAIDGGLGIGLLSTKYRHYAGSSTYPTGHEEEQHDDHLIWKEDGHLNLLAATHANISIAYLFDVQSIIPKRWRKKP